MSRTSQPSSRARWDKPARADGSTRPGKNPRSGKPTRYEAPKRSAKAERFEASRSGSASRSEAATRSSAPTRFETPTGSGKATRSEAPTWRQRPDRPARPTRADRPARTDRPARSDRPTRSDRPIRSTRPARTERATRAPRPAVVPALTGPNAFVDLGVPASLAAVLASQAITEPTPIQTLTIPAALTGRDVLGRGRTGSGKTLAFVLPMLVALNGRRGRPRQPRGLVLAPTRELAMQVLDVARPLAAAVGLRVQLVIGGSSYDRQIRGLERADLVVATPGRLVDLADRGSVDLSAVTVVVLDEADHMADLGFLPELRAILDRLPDTAQGLLFSATLDADVDRLVRTYLHDPVEHSADPATATVGTMAHHVVLVHPKDKDAVTADIALRTGRTVAFVRTQLGADRLAGQLAAEGVRTAALHGGMKQGMRTRTLADFRAGGIDVLVATDVAARGIHVDDIDLVLHVDLPHGPKEYLHRSGRTARAGARGTVVSLATLRQERAARAIAAKAGVTPGVLRARPGDQALRELVG